MKIWEKSQVWRQKKWRLSVWRCEDHKKRRLSVKTVFLNEKIMKMTHHGTTTIMVIGILVSGILSVLAFYQWHAVHRLLFIGISALPFCLVTLQALAFWVMVFWLLALNCGILPGYWEAKTDTDQHSIKISPKNKSQQFWMLALPITWI